MKLCKKCKKTKSVDNFCKHSKNKDGLQAYCKPCVAQSVIKYQKENKDKVNKKNSEYKKKYKVWLRPENRSYCKHRAALRKTRQPLWASIKLIQEMYMKATKLNVTVDHIVPLQSSLVCGLHCEDNLQLLPSGENSSKGNRYWDGMWGIR